MRNNDLKRSRNRKVRRSCSLTTSVRIAGDTIELLRGSSLVETRTWKRGQNWSHKWPLRRKERERERKKREKEEEKRSVLFTSWRPRFTAEYVSLRRRRMTEGARKTASNCSYPPADVQLGLYKWTALIPFCRVQRATAEVYPEIVADDL